MIFKCLPRSGHLLTAPALETRSPTPSSNGLRSVRQSGRSPTYTDTSVHRDTSVHIHTSTRTLAVIVRNPVECTRGT